MPTTVLRAPRIFRPCDGPVGGLKMSTFCQCSYHRKCQRRGVGGQKSQNLVNVVCERPPTLINQSKKSLSCKIIDLFKKLQSHSTKSKLLPVFDEFNCQFVTYQPQVQLWTLCSLYRCQSLSLFPALLTVIIIHTLRPTYTV